MEFKPPVPIKKEKSTHEALLVKIGGYISMPPGDYADLAPDEFIRLSREDQREMVKGVLLGLKDNLRISGVSRDYVLGIEEKRYTIANESIEAELFTPREIQDLI